VSLIVQFTRNRPFSVLLKTPLHRFESCLLYSVLVEFRGANRESAHTQRLFVKCFRVELGVSVGIRKYGDRNVIDLSEWGRPIARVIAQYLKEKRVSVIQVTNFHLILSLFCAWLIFEGHTIVACSYWDTVVDTIGLIAVMCAFGSLFDWQIAFTFAMILAILFQYSLFNHYSILMRALGSGDDTSRIDERICPVAHPWEKQKNVNVLHFIYLCFFNWQDRIISKLTGKGSESLVFELTISSSLGYGMQSLLIFLLALTQNLAYLPHLVLGVNGFLMALVVLRSRL